MTKERPILFSTEMVQAILDGRKTQTRRILKPQPEFGIDDSCYSNESPFALKNEHGGCTCRCVKCPYGLPDDLLWVRETWKPVAWDVENCGLTIEYKSGGQKRIDYIYDDSEKDTEFMLKCCDSMMGVEMDLTDGDFDTWGWSSDLIRRSTPWRPSIHLPKNAARIWLRVKEVRVERLHDISNADARAEGIERAKLGDSESFKDYGSRADFPTQDINQQWADPVASFTSLWKSIHGEGSWNQNPWVWVVEFEVLSTTGRPEAKSEQPKASSHA